MRRMSKRFIVLLATRSNGLNHRLWQYFMFYVTACNKNVLCQLYGNAKVRLNKNCFVHNHKNFSSTEGLKHGIHLANCELIADHCELVELNNFTYYIQYICTKKAQNS